MGGAMTRVRNTTDLSDDVVREVIEFVRPNGVRNVDVNVENRSWGRGSGRSSNAGYVTVRLSTGPFDRPYHWNSDHKGGYCFDGWLHSKVELLVMLLAHELRHQWQFGVGQSLTESLRRTRVDRVKGAYVGVNRTKAVFDAGLPETATVKRGRVTYSRASVKTVRIVRRRPVGRRRGQKGGKEEDADRYAMTMVRAWRREHPTVPCWEAAGMVEVISGATL